MGNESTVDSRAVIRQIAREEVISLCELVLSRVHDVYDTKGEMRVDEDTALKAIASIFGGALAEFGGSRDQPRPEGA